MTPVDQLNALKQTLQAVGRDQESPDALAQACANASLCRQALPPRFGERLDDLVSRLQTASLFADESCSVSRRDIVAAIDQWLDQGLKKLA